MSSNAKVVVTSTTRNADWEWSTEPWTTERERMRFKNHNFPSLCCCSAAGQCFLSCEVGLGAPPLLATAPSSNPKPQKFVIQRDFSPGHDLIKCPCWLWLCLHKITFWQMAQESTGWFRVKKPLFLCLVHHAQALIFTLLVSVYVQSASGDKTQNDSAQFPSSHDEKTLWIEFWQKWNSFCLAWQVQKRGAKTRSHS